MYIIPCCVHGSFVLSAYCFTCREQTLNQRHLPICLLAADAIKEEIFLHPVVPRALQGYLHSSCCYITVDDPVATTNPKAILFLARTTAAASVPFYYLTLCVPRDNMTCIAQHIPVILNKSLTDGIRLAHLSVFILKL